MAIGSHQCLHGFQMWLPEHLEANFEEISANSFSIGARKLWSIYLWEWVPSISPVREWKARDTTYSCHDKGPTQLRGSGATHLYLATEGIALIAWRGRCTNATTSGFYLQEVGAQLVLHRFYTIWAALQDLASSFSLCTRWRFLAERWPISSGILQVSWGWKISRIAWNF